MRGAVVSRLAALLGCAVVVAASPPSASASGVPGSGNGSPCTPVVTGQVHATTPTRVDEHAAVSCPMVSGPANTPYGAPKKANPTAGGGTPGQPCRYVVEQPIRVVTTADGKATQLDPNYDGTHYGTFTYPSFMPLYPVQMAAKYNSYVPYLFTGKYDAAGSCTVPVGGRQGYPPGWNLGCPDPDPFGNFVVVGNVCQREYPNAVARPGGIDRNLLAPYLAIADLVQFIGPGTLSSMPDNPAKGLVQIGTCFFIRGAVFQGAGAPPQPVDKPATYEMSIPEPVNDGTGRFVFYVIRIQLAYQGAVWNFGDGSSAVDATPPQDCVSATQPGDILASHTYTRYGDYHVTVAEQYAATVDEFWSDADGERHVTLNGVVPPIPPRVLGPYDKGIVQAEGVPVVG
jgi:hypothetical protein